MNTQASTSPVRKVYHLRYWLLYAMLITPCFLILPVLTICLAVASPVSFNGGLAVSLILLSLLSLGLAAALVFGLWKTRLVVALAGIAYYSPGYRVYSPWWNIKGIGSMRPG